jgi:hypothetical protein
MYCEITTAGRDWATTLHRMIQFRLNDCGIDFWFTIPGSGSGTGSQSKKGISARAGYAERCRKGTDRTVPVRQ